MRLKFLHLLWVLALVTGTEVYYEPTAQRETLDPVGGIIRVLSDEFTSTTLYVFDLIDAASIATSIQSVDMTPDTTLKDQKNFDEILSSTDILISTTDKSTEEVETGALPGFGDFFPSSSTSPKSEPKISNSQSNKYPKPSNNHDVAENSHLVDPRNFAEISNIISSNVEYKTSPTGLSSTSLHGSISNSIVDGVKVQKPQVFTITADVSSSGEKSVVSTQEMVNESIDGRFDNITNLQELNDSSLNLEVYRIDFDDPLVRIENNLDFNSSLHQNQQYANANSSTDECRFMSFEEWKKLKENFTSQSKSTVMNNGVNDKANSESEVPVDAGETCIELALVNSSKSVEQYKKTPPKVEDHGKVYKNRFNYASVDCAATIVDTNPDAKGAALILMENKESYLINKCSSPNKFVIVELCQDILVESFVIGNFEFFSSTFKDIRVSVSDRYPNANWHKLGEFEAKNIRDIQTFTIENSLIWAKYLKLEILSHYGDEFYCPISILRVHGKSVMDEVKEDKESLPKEENPTDIIEPIDLNSTIGIDHSKFEQCRVRLPHLQLTDFLQDINSTDQYCDAPETTPVTKSTQESFYKNIMKRLTLLESNASLSLLYIEEQSKLLSEAFTSLEQRQTNNFKGLVQSFNNTIVNQLTNFKSSYVYMHNEYAKLFKIQENNHQLLLMDSKARITSLSRELTFQRAISIFNTIIIICLLVYVIFTRGTYIDDYANRSPQSSYFGHKRQFIVGNSKKSRYPPKRRR
jgi:hypothetical protein